MCSNLFQNRRPDAGFSIVSRGRPRTKPSVLKHLKKLIRSSHSSSSRPQVLASSSTSVESHRRRAEALKSCGLLKQSVKYGDPYHDDEDDTKTIVSPEKRSGENTGVKDLLIFEDKVEEYTMEKEHVFDSADERVMPAYTPTSPSTPFSDESICMVSGSSITDSSPTVESDSSTLTPRRPPVRMRRIGSLTEEIDQIEDEETRHLTEVAFLS